MSPTAGMVSFCDGRYNRTGEQHVVIVAGHLVVDAEQREAYLAGCVGVVEEARRATGCLDFANGADLVDPGRINIFERWESQASPLHRARGEMETWSPGSSCDARTVVP